jgi:hypothetical protein
MLRLLVLALVLFAAPAFAQTCPPIAPVDVVATRSGADVVVTWRDPSTAACKAEHFAVEASKLGEDVRELRTDDTGIIMPTVPYGGRWRFVVRSFNEEGLSPAANVYLVEAQSGCFEGPPTPSASVASASGTLVTVQWLVADRCAITGFRISAASSPDGPEIASVRTSFPNTRSFSAYAPAGTYYLRVYTEFYGLTSGPSPVAVVTVQ